ncbi:Protein YicC [hydrothermal vent metagenome]|uniref:Protein YicC n=1 Tax=hydrothermal vent metagenome TaxID=652676 RepID=A0A3B1B9E9_9ZZZZ
MVLSMTAFARQETSANWGAMSLELRSVNHRFLELNLRLPEELRSIEPKIRERISVKICRGKLDLSLRLQTVQTDSNNIVINKELATQVVSTCQEIDALIGNPAMLNSIEILRWPGVITAAETDNDELQKAFLGILDVAIDELLESRQREGAKLGDVILSRCEKMSSIVAAVRERLPQVNKLVHDKILSKLKSSQLELDENRFAQEVAYMVQKMDVDEEMDRLATHISEVQRVLTEQKPIGRRLDFLMQELNREANTLGSKSADTATTNFSVELKVLIEQIREQVQNIE